jgi:hypothetical protein
VTSQSQHAAFAENLFASLEEVSTGTTPDRTLFPDHDESGTIAGLQEHEAAGNCDRLRGPPQPASVSTTRSGHRKRESAEGPSRKPTGNAPEREAKQSPLRAAYGG